MTSDSKPLTKIEEKRILVEFNLQQANEALEKRKNAKRCYPNFGLLMNTLIFICIGFFYAYTNGRIGLLVLFISGMPLFLNILWMFDGLCRDVKAINEKLSNENH